MSVTSLSPGCIQIADNDIPQLVAGEYEITVKATINDYLKAEQSPIASQKFTVTGPPKLSVEPDQIYSIAPLDQSTGLYETTLPHVIFKNANFPWERPNGHREDAAPWIFLMVLSDDDLQDIKDAQSGPSVTRAFTFKVMDLKNSSDAPQYFKTNDEFFRDFNDDSNNPTCNVISISNSLFKSFMNGESKSSKVPKFFSHSRNINTGMNVVDGLTENGFYSVTFANRFPTKTDTRVHLVSLEPFNNNYEYEDSYIQLISLKSWTINCAPAETTFIDYFTHLNLDPLTLKRDPSSDPDSQIVHQRFINGYIPVKHHLPTGEDSLAWYRGPFTPVRMAYPPNLPTNASNLISSTNGTSLLIYEPTYGTFDVTYAIAWQLGRVLALSDKSYVVNLMQFRKNVTNQAMNQLKQLPFTPTQFSKSIDSIIKTSIHERIGQPSFQTNSNLFPRIKSSTLDIKDVNTNIYEAFTSVKNNNADPDPANEVNDLLSKIIGWLIDLSSLNKVPFHYLIPDSELLPTESIRFFQIDSYWIQVLIDGALSIGSHTSTDIEINKHIYRELYLDIQSPLFTQPKAGLLLRSQLVSAYPAITPKIGNGNGVPANDQSSILKTQRLGKNILLSTLLVGSVLEIVFIEPHEHLRMGFTGDLFDEAQFIPRNADGTSSSRSLDPKSEGLVNSNNIIQLDAILKLIPNSEPTEVSPWLFGIQMIPPPKAYVFRGS